jgi:hypothetical protein
MSPRWYSRTFDPNSKEQSLLSSTIDLLAHYLSSLSDSLRKDLKNRLGILPSDTSIGDADTVFQTRLAFLGNFLVT